MTFYSGNDGVHAGTVPSQLNLDSKQFFSYGRLNPDDLQEPFCMTILALTMSRSANAVSELMEK